jgi:hypothetical protein
MKSSNQIPAWLVVGALALGGCPSGPSGMADAGGVLGPDGCVPACGGRTCGPDPICGVSCGSCTGGVCGADGTCSGGGPGAPRILSFTSSRTALGEGGRTTFTAIVTDPDGIDDLIGGMLVDGATGGTYGAFATSAAEGAYSLDLEWFQIMGSLDSGLSPTPRVFRARFYDVDGHASEAELTLSLGCAGGELLCGHSCVPPDNNHCASCTDRCGGSEGEGGEPMACIDHVCQSTATPAPVIDSVEATIETPMPPEGWGSFFRVRYSARGHAEPSQVYYLSSALTDGPSGFTWTGSDSVTFETAADGSFSATEELTIMAADRSSSGPSPHVGTFTLTVRVSSFSGETMSTRDTTLEIPSCHGTREWLACAPTNRCDAYYRDEACGSCGTVCGGSHTITHYPGTPSAYEVTGPTECFGAAGCAFAVFADNNNCATNCERNGATCVGTRAASSDVPAGLCTTYFSRRQRCLCAP